MSASKDLSYDERLLQAAVRFLLEGEEIYPARLLLHCAIDVGRLSRRIRYPREYTVRDVKVALSGPRAVFDALEPRTNVAVGQSIRRAFLAVIGQNDRLERLSARLQTQPIESSDWRNRLWGEADEIEAKVHSVAATQAMGHVEQNDETEEQEVATTNPSARRVFVVHGRDLALRDAMFAFLHSIGLHPIEWSQAVAATQIATPYVGQILDAAFSEAQAVVVLLTPDDEARLREPYWSTNEPDYEKELTPQARPNVLFEAGMALGRYPDRTVIVEVGVLRPFSDVVGRHVIRMDGSPAHRLDLAQRLETAGCAVDRSGTNWITAGNLAATSEPSASAPVPAQNQLFTDASLRSISNPIPPQSPLLVPEGTPIFHEVKENWLKWDERTQSLTITNLGASAAFNVVSVLYGCESYIIQGNRDENSRNEHWTCWLGKPVPVNGAVAVTFEKGNGIFFDDHKHIGGYAFNAPAEPGPKELLKGKGAARVARVVITYQNSGGHKFASIFDYILHRAGWDRVATIAVDEDLHDLQG